jgi:peptidoglycan/xylan/chitin deacetylase (PgdA/CDA1 family)
MKKGGKPRSARRCRIRAVPVGHHRRGQLPGQTHVDGLLYEYGSRAGFWRIHNEFQKRGLPLTVFGVAMALARHPEIVEAIKAADYDVVSHGWRWIHYQNMDISQEREHLQKAVHVLTDLFGKPPTGWYTGRDSPNTRQLVVEHGGLTTTATTMATIYPSGRKWPAATAPANRT